MSFANFYEIGLSEKLVKKMKVEETIHFQKFLNKIDMTKYKSILKRGDVIGLLNHSSYGYRNDGKVMWDGNFLIELEGDYDDYGHVPHSFVVGKDFDNVFYWQNLIKQRTFMESSMTIDHNFLFYASFDKSRVSNLYQIDKYFTFNYNRDEGKSEVWTIRTNDIENYFTNVVISGSYQESENRDDYDEDEIDITNTDIDLSRYIIDLSGSDNLFDFSSYDNLFTESNNVVESPNETEPPIFVRNVTSNTTLSSQDIINSIDILTENDNVTLSYEFVDYRTLSVWKWVWIQNEAGNQYSILLTLNNNNDIEYLKNLEISTVYHWQRCCTSFNEHSYVWEKKDKDTKFVQCFNNSMKFAVKKYGLIASKQVITQL